MSSISSSGIVSVAVAVLALHRDHIGVRYHTGISSVSGSGACISKIGIDKVNR